MLYERLDLGGLKQPHDIKPKYEWDIMDCGGGQIVYDLNCGNPFPLEDNSIKNYYCSMTLEHVHPTKVQFVIDEIYRTLMPKGIVRIIVPDISIGMDWYLNHPERLKSKGQCFLTEGYHPPTKCGLLFAWIRSEFLDGEDRNGRAGHQMIFDWETLEWFLKKTPFSKIERMSHNQCSDVFIGKDGPRYANWGLYVEATK